MSGPERGLITSLPAGNSGSVRAGEAEILDEIPRADPRTSFPPARGPTWLPRWQVFSSSYIDSTSSDLYLLSASEASANEPESSR